jgi:hypothetical protein
MRNRLLAATVLLNCFCISTVVASEFSRVDSDIQKYDEELAAMNAQFEQVSADPNNKEWVKSKLSHMYGMDQYMRRYSNTPAERGYSSGEQNEFYKQFMPRWLALDTANTKDLKMLLDIYRWFTISEFGVQADEQAWLLVQHADADAEFQNHVLGILAELWPIGETVPSNYAYLYDRVAASWMDEAKRKLQRFGTQGTCVGPGLWAPLPVENPDSLDQRRASVGLGPEAEYIALFKNVCR